MADDWQIQGKKRVHGPFSLAQLRQLMDLGKLFPETQLRPDQNSPWQPARTVPDLFTVLAESITTPDTSPRTNNSPAGSTASHSGDAWFYMEGSQPHGPLTFAEMVLGAKQGLFGLETPVWNPDVEAWAPAFTIAELIHKPTAPPPQQTRPHTVKPQAGPGDISGEFDLPDRDDVQDSTRPNRNPGPLPAPAEPHFTVVGNTSALDVLLDHEFRHFYVRGLVRFVWVVTVSTAAFLSLYLLTDLAIDLVSGKSLTVRLLNWSATGESVFSPADKPVIPRTFRSQLGSTMVSLFELVLLGGLVIVVRVACECIIVVFQIEKHLRPPFRR